MATATSGHIGELCCPLMSTVRTEPPWGGLGEWGSMDGETRWSARMDRNKVSLTTPGTPIFALCGGYGLRSTVEAGNDGTPWSNKGVVDEETSKGIWKNRTHLHCQRLDLSLRGSLCNVSDRTLCSVLFLNSHDSLQPDRLADSTSRPNIGRLTRTAMQ